MSRALILFVLACLFGLGGGYAFGAMLAMIFSHGNVQGAVLWGLAAAAVLAIGGWCGLASRRAVSRDAGDQA
ncbi:hypothetical protein [Aquisalinus flavus]|uniref:Uncharacterized protein n=1 Tax=Aquisalinus flavus TaxID=1526572 RepID=A0A8J2Y7K0_9PROT|nr:hypothetical protein [Aquisalinus flavus]MBD0425487.1 hypothetical protein [Aquisalinus flavus]UNE48880.1 hypothetical protein FF099_12875 [Aquisalinus flavus]GGD15685.1 hypothetical protein GCM10011342_25560 [Aquisalinus flavus]